MALPVNRSQVVQATLKLDRLIIDIDVNDEKSQEMFEQLLAIKEDLILAVT